MDFANLAFFVVAFAFALLTAWTVDRSFATVSELVGNLTTFNIAPLAGSGLESMLPCVAAILLAVLAAYIPLTHMAHFIGKYFTYHAVRWDDRPLAGNRRIAAALAESLTYRSRWAAGHVSSGQPESWADVVAANPAKEEQR